MAKKKGRIKVAGYSQRTFFNDNIEYRNFSDDLVGLQFASVDGSPLFTMGNFSVTTNLSPKLNKTYNTGAYSEFFTLNDLDEEDSESLKVQKQQISGLNLNLSDPLSYVWYGSTTELIRVSLENIKKYFPAAIYVDNKVGSISGNNITNYSYDAIKDETTFTVSTNYFVNPFEIEYTIDSLQLKDVEDINKLRNLTYKYKSYTIEHNGISKKIIDYSGASQSTNSIIRLTVEGNPFPEITGINFSQFYFLNSLLDASIPFFIKPNEVERENFFTSLNELEKNLLNRNVTPIYTSVFNVPQQTDSGVIVYTQKQLTFPILSDGYNLNFFDGLYITYLDNITKIGDDLDDVKTDLIKRKYTAHVITSFDTMPRGDGDNVTLDGAKATKLLRIYGVSFDNVKKYINGIKFAHIVTYDKKENVPDSLVKDLAYMLGLEKVDFLTHLLVNKNILPSEGMGQFSGTSTQLSLQQIDIELYRRLVLNVAWLWKSKGARKAIEFLFRFIGAPEALVSFDEHIVIADKPVNISKLRQLLFLYTGSSDDINLIPFDDYGYPLPPSNGALVVLDWIEGTSIVYEPKDNTELTEIELEACKNYKLDLIEHEKQLNQSIEYNDPQWKIDELSNTLMVKTDDYNKQCSNIVTKVEENKYTDMYFQKAGGWYRETGGLNPTIDIRSGNNPHAGPYDRGNAYLAQFTQCPIPEFSPKTTFQQTTEILKENQFVNYNYGFINGITDDSELYITLLEGNNNQFIPNCVDIYTSVVTAPVSPSGTTVYQDIFNKAIKEYNEWEKLIEKDCGLIYSPEWQIIKHNYHIATSNYGKELSSAHCNYNQALEICLDVHTFPITDNPITSCDYYTAVKEDGFIYFLTDDGEEIFWDGFKNCCIAEGGTYHSYITVDGEDGYFCAYESPCKGEVHGVREDNIVIWEMAGTNTTNDNLIYQVGDICVTPIWDGDHSNERQRKQWTHCAHHQNIGGGYDPGTPRFDDWIHNNTQAVLNNIPMCFTVVDCNATNTFIETSVECCVYNNYNYQIITVYEGDISRNIIVCVEKNDTGPEPNSDIVAIKEEINQLQKRQSNIDKENKENPPSTNGQSEIRELEKTNLEIQEKTLIAQLDRLEKEYTLVSSLKSDKGYSEYQPHTNLNANIQNAEIPVVLNNPNGSYTTGMSYRSDNYPDYPELPNNPDGSDFGAVWDIPELMDCSAWKVYEVDEYGRISFTPVNPTIQGPELDWLSTSKQGGKLYKECCVSKGYIFGQFLVNPTNGELVPIEEAMTYQPQSIVNACVDPNYTTCTALNNIKLILANNGQNGFYIPNDWNNTTIDIRFDYMIKYDPQSLIDCATQDNCGNALDLYKNSLYNLNCRNFIVFTETESIKDTLENNIQFVDTDFLHIHHPPTGVAIEAPIYGDGIPQIIPHWTTENIKVWQTPGIQYENEECCVALGGTFISESEWESTHESNVSTIEHSYKSLIKLINKMYGPDASVPDGGFNIPTWANVEMIKAMQNYLDISKEINGLLSEPCIHYSIFEPKIYCDDFEDIITTRNICMLKTPIKCGIYSQLLQNYWVSINQLQIMKAELELCNTGQKARGKLIEEIDRNIISTRAAQYEANKQAEDIVDEFNTKIEIENLDLVDINVSIREIDSTTLAIESLTGDDAEQLDCNAYQQQTQLIRDFDVKGYCRVQSGGRQERRPGGGPELDRDITSKCNRKCKHHSNDDDYWTCFDDCKSGGINKGGTGVSNETQWNIYNECVSTKQNELDNEQNTYNSLFESCSKTNQLNTDIKTSKKAGNTRKVDLYSEEYEIELNRMNELEKSKSYCETIIELNEELRQNNLQKNNVLENVEIVAKILDVPTSTVRDGEVNLLTNDQITELQIVDTVNKSQKNRLVADKYEKETTIADWNKDKSDVVEEWETTDLNTQVDLSEYDNAKSDLVSDYNSKKCCIETLLVIEQLLNTMLNQREHILGLTQDCYEEWYNDRYKQYEKYLKTKLDDVLTFIDELKIKFTLEVDNNVIGTVPPSLIHANLTTLNNLTDRINPIWEWYPAPYSGVIIEGETNVEQIVKDSIFQSLTNQGYSNLTNIFTPQWQTLNFTLDSGTCGFLQQCYPGRQLFIGIEIENYECDVCILVDNLQIKTDVSELSYLYNTEDCPMPELTCVIDNKKSWVYYDKGVKYIDYEIVPGNCLPCKVPCDVNFETTNKQRLWQNLEYRYTDYDFSHSDLIINTKSAVFKIDPAKAIECDVYNFWQNIDCDNCPTSCHSGETITYDGKVRMTTTSPLTGYTIDLSGGAGGSLGFSCDTYTTLLSNQVKELKDEVYTLTADYNLAISSTYNTLIDCEGGSLDEFKIQTNNCGGETIIMGNYNDINNLSGLLVEGSEGTLEFWNVYIYDDTTPYIGGNNIEILSGITAQTFNQTSGITSECCKSLNTLLTTKGRYGMGLEKNYVWNESLSGCTWRYINDCHGDCSHYGSTTVNNYTGSSTYEICITGTTSGNTTGYTAGYCIAPYSLTPEEDACQYIITSAATYGGSSYTAYTGNDMTAYSLYGARFYDLDINQTNRLPYEITGITSAVYSQISSEGPILPKATVTGVNLWASGGLVTEGRLNNCGIWATNPAPHNNGPFGTWLGFSACLDITNSGIYCLGMAADNHTRFYLDGQIIFTSENLNFGIDDDLLVWKVFELQLTSGEHIFEMYGMNDNFEAGFGAEIYSATTAQLSGMTTELELSAVTLFTTADYRTDVVGSTELFELGATAYSCPAGWSFSHAPCYASPTCIQILNTGLTYDITGSTSATTFTACTTHHNEVYDICGKCYEYDPEIERCDWTDISFTGQSFLGSSFINDSTGWLCSTDGETWKTNDSGKSWSATTSGLSGDRLFDIQFIDALSGYTCGDNGYFGETTDGGLTWTEKSVGIPASHTLISLHFIDKDIGWVGGTTGIGAGAILYSTIDGGNNWSLVATNVEFVGQPAVYSVFFINNNLGKVGTPNNIYSTIDGGTTWTLDTGSGYPGLGTVWDIKFIDTTTGWASANNGVWWTTDFGDTWTLTPISLGHQYTCIAPIDVNNLFVVGSGNGLTPAIWRSTNGGASYEIDEPFNMKSPYDTPPTPYIPPLYTISMVSATHGFAAGATMKDSGGIIHPGLVMEYSCSTTPCTISEEMVEDPIQLKKWMLANYCNDEFNNCFREVVCCDVKEIDICVTPVDLLDTPPSKIQVKQVFDEMVKRNLIDATNRQTISAYPTLELFYELYLRANNCGKDIGSKLTYTNLFQFMDLIGDYWLELLEQVIPATTIMEGCDNSGKVYRNTIFHNNKFNYKKYVLNYADCCVTQMTSQAIGCEDVDVTVEELCVAGDCMGSDIKGCKHSVYLLEQQINELGNQIHDMQMIVDAGGANCGYTDQQLNDLEVTIALYNNDLNNLQVEHSDLSSECEIKESQYYEAQSALQEQKEQCIEVSHSIQDVTEAIQQLQAAAGSDPLPSSSHYGDIIINLQQLLKQLKEYLQKNCGTINDPHKSTYGKVFITQIYNTNEYEGNVIVYGDDDWDLNDQLINDCDNRSKEYIINNGR